MAENEMNEIWRERKEKLLRIIDEDPQVNYLADFPLGHRMKIGTKWTIVSK